jgi:CDP-diacylglycerol--glycerol-3-phosphate 3-phosphatidyltransferase
LTPANALTLGRLLVTPVLIGIVAASGPGWLPFGLALAVGATDVADGWIARRQGVTRSGAFLDPLADKVAVVGVLCAVAARGEVPWLPVGLVAARELLMQVYRSVMGRRGVSIPARRSAKVKTLVQGIAALLAITPSLSAHHTVLQVVLWVAVALTLASGVQYVIDGRRAALGPPPDAAGRPGALGSPDAGVGPVDRVAG